jgi:2-C-methyl-D-erythritol 2,4-cyclodiphosphate synthase
MRIGYGWDSHAFKAGVPLKIGGLLIDHPEGLAGHSDGDVLLHAITDALLGAVAAGDIGSFFPPTDPQWKGADSALFLSAALDEVEKAGFSISNVDTTLILAAPKIAPLAKHLQNNVARLLGIETTLVGIKAKTPEGLDQDNVAIAHAVVLLDKNAEQKKMELVAAALESQQVMEEAVESAVSDVELDDDDVTVGRARPAKWGKEDLS